MTNTRVPPALTSGDRIRLVAPSGVVDRVRFDQGVREIERAGFRPVFDDGVFESLAYLAGDDDRRRAELEAALADDEASAIWVVRGGYGCTRLLPFLAPDAVARQPRWLIGFSDVTALHALWHRAGLATIHGPNVSTLGRWGDDARRALFDTLCGRAPVRLPGRLVQGPAGAQGPLLGGNLSLLAAMAGTGALPDLDGALLLLEDVGEPAYRLDRYLTQLRQTGVLDGLRGVVLGQFSHARGDADAPSAEAVLDALLRGLGDETLPVLAGVPVGHEPSSWPVPLGRAACLEGDGLSFP